MLHIHHLWSSQQPREKEESEIQKGYLTFLKSISKFSSQGLALQATLQFKDLLSSGPMHFLFYITFSGYFNRTHFRKVHYLNRIGPEKWYQESYWLNFLSSEVSSKWGRKNISSAVSVSLFLPPSFSLSPSIILSLLLLLFVLTFSRKTFTLNWIFSCGHQYSER